MLGIFANKTSSEKTRQKIARFVERRKFADALKLQRALCEEDAENAREWRVLSEIAHQSGDRQVELKALVAFARLSRAPAEEWLRVAELAKELADPKQLVAAEFRAGEAFALIGDALRAIEYLDRVLAAEPNHPMARRLRQLMLSKVKPSAPIEKSGTIGEPTKVGLGVNAGLRPIPSEEITLTFLRGSTTRTFASNMGLAYEDPRDLLDVEESTTPGWSRPAPNLGTSDNPTPARYVCTPQQWPTVLSERPLIFIGEIGDWKELIDEVGEEVDVTAGSALQVQGQPSQLLYAVRRGTVHVHRTWDREYDLGQIQEGFFFAELGALMGFPSTTTVIADSDAVVDVVTHQRVIKHITDRQGTPAIVRQLRSWYLDTVFQICPLSRFDSDNWRAEQHHIRWKTFQKGDVLSTSGDSATLYVLLTGFARVAMSHEGGYRTLGYLCPGDLCGEIDPSPVDVVAESTVAALKINRQRVDQLVPEAIAAYEQRIGACRAAVSTSDGVR